MLTITISTRALLIALIVAALAIAAVFATDALAASGDQVQGDVNCDQGVDNNDILAQLKHEAGFDVAQTEPCTDIEDAFPLGGTGIPGPSGPPGPSGEPGPTGPPGPSGAPAITYWATVRSDGVKLNGTATSTLRDGLGSYKVTLPVDVTGCANFVTPGLVGTSGDVAFTYFGTQTEAFGDNVIHVGFVNHAAASQDTGFHIAVIC